MLSGGRELGSRPPGEDVPRGKGHVLLFANNPMWRNHARELLLIFNALLNFDPLGVGRKAAATD